MDITPYIQLMLDKKAESLSLEVDRLPQLNIKGKKHDIGSATASDEMIKTLFNSTVTEQQKIQFSTLPSIRYSAYIGNYSFHLYAHEKNNKLLFTIRPDSSKPVREKVVEAADLDIYSYLKKVNDLEGSDLFISPGATIMAKVEGESIELDSFILSPKMTYSIAKKLTSEIQFEQFKEKKELDFAINMPDDSARFRVNIFYQRGTVGLVIRVIPISIPKVEDLGLPNALLDMVMAKHGLFLMVGSSGTGKSTTLAALINHRNLTSSGHILTIEDPIEFTHPNLTSLVNQREVGVDTQSYAQALKSSFREAPDVVLIGEIRDRETMEAALELANTGHLCISTLHATNASQALDRITNMFPQLHHKQLFIDLSTNLTGIVSQRLIPDINGKRCAAVEVMVNSPHISGLILNGKFSEIREAMGTSGADGMKIFDEALLELYQSKRISLEEALKNADSENDLEAKINFG